MHLVQQISFAKSRSDAVVKKLDSENFDAHKAQRTQHKSLLLRLRFVIFIAILTTRCRGHQVHESSEAEVPCEEGK